MRNRRAIFLTAVTALTLTGGLSACGGGYDKAKIQADIDAGNAGPNSFPDSANAADKIEAQNNADEDAREAKRALERRKELADLEKTQQAETERLMKDGVAGGNDDDSEIPIGSADPALEEFRAKLAGVCAGGQKRILKVQSEVEKATKSKDPIKILAAAQSFSTALNDFMAALNGLNPPASVRSDYRDWLATINALSDNVRLQVVSSGDPKKSVKLQAKTTELTQKLVMQSAALGVTCLSVTG